VIGLDRTGDRSAAASRMAWRRDQTL